ncbi:hypothetical protein ACWEJ6_21025 [Nonomuraea sp. NPDC004702]
MSTDLPTHLLTGLQALGFRRNGDPIWPVLGASEEHEDGDPEQEETSEEEAPEEGEGEQDDKDKPLGPAGEKALAAEKEKRKTAAAQARAEKARADAAEAELAKLRRAAEKAKSKPEEKADDAPDREEIRREAEQAAIAKANDRIVRAEIRAAAAGKLADPADALSFLDLTQFEVDADGNIDADQVADAIDDLLKKKPYLAPAQGDGKRFKGSGDGGAKPNKPTRPKSLTEAVTKALSPS